MDNPDGFRFCGACANPLVSELAPPTEERKVVTVLFCDLVGFTARSDRADPEDVRATLRPYHARVRKEIERFGGTVEKFIGDAVMAVFGAPAAHEDDAERAVRSALRITGAIAELNQGTPGLELAVRIGINTGEAVVALGARPEQGEGIVTGDVVNTAARLQTVAPVGGIVVGEVTYRATKDLIQYEQLDAVEVKGKADPVPIWGALAAAGRFGVDVDQTAQAPFIGRDDDLGLLEQTYSRILRDGSIQTITITGEPGVGKSRLLFEFRTALDDKPGMTYWRQGRCLSYGEGITFWALGEMVKAQCGILESDAPDQAREKIDVALRALVEPSDHDWLRARLLPLVGVGPSDGDTGPDREESFTAWRAFLEAIASHTPLVLVFEDLHWADQALLDFVEHLIDWSTGVPLMVICTARPELYERRPEWGGGKRNSTTLSLLPLSDDDTARLIAALLSQAVLPAEVQSTLIERSGGNPLYAEEFVRMLTDRGILERRGPALRLAQTSEIPVPESVQAIIASRLDTLAPERKSLLQDASVVGKVFWSGAVAFMANADERRIRDNLHDLSRKELVRPARNSSVKDQAEYSFWHALVRDVAYGQIPRAQRARRHRLAAEWIERIAGDRVADHAEFLAHHYQRAVDLVRASGGTEDTEELTDRTRRFLVMAGDRSRELDVAKSEAHYRAALDLTPQGHPDRGRVLLKAATAASDSGRLSISESEGELDSAIDELRSVGDLPRMGKAILILGRDLWVAGETDRSRSLLDQAVEVLERVPPGRELARAYAQIAGSEMLADHHPECRAWTKKALELARRLGAREIEQRALQMQGIMRFVEGDAGGLSDLEEGLRMCLELGLGGETVIAHVNVADWTALTQDRARGLDLYRRAIDFAERRGLMPSAMWARAETTWHLFELGRWDELIRVADEVFEWDTRSGRGSQRSMIVLAQKARVLGYRGKVAEAAGLADRFLPQAREIKDPQVMWPALETAAVIEAARGRFEEATALVRELVRDADEHPEMRSILFPVAPRVLVSAGRVEEAEDLVSHTTPMGPWLIPNMTAARAIMAEAEGRMEEAVALHEEAADAWTRAGTPLEHGQALLGAGRCLVALGRRASADDKLSQAREIFESLRTRPLLVQTDAWLQRATALSS